MVEDLNGFQKLVFLEIGPPSIGEIEFSVRSLPKKEVGEAMLSAGSNQQIRVRLTGGEQMLAYGGLGERVPVKLPCLALMCDTLNRLHKFAPSAIAQSQIQSHASATACFDNILSKDSAHILWQAILLPETEQAYIVLQHGAQFRLQVAFQQTHQAAHLSGRSVPVLRGKRVKGEHFNANFAGSLDDFPDGIHAGFVPE